MNETIKDIELFLLDIDGTISLEERLITGAKEFIETLIEQEKKYIFLTNNSSKSVEEYICKFKRMGIPADKENILTSGQATAVYLEYVKKHANIYVVGTKALKKEFVLHGFNVIEDGENIDFVVVGFDTELTYEKLTKACKFIDEGAPFIATNPDLICPIENNRFIPDCGSICQVIENVTGKKPTYLGKPKKEIVYLAAEKENVDLSKVAVIGDRLYTDIASGINAGIISICVLSGETHIEHIKMSNIKPTFVANSIYDVYKELIKGDNTRKHVLR